MKRAGQIVLFSFPNTDLRPGKLRPVLLLKRLPGPYDDWLVCLISSQLQRRLEKFDEIVASTDKDFAQSGLKSPSVIRVSRLAVVEGVRLVGAIGEIDADRLRRIAATLAMWLTEN